MTTIDALVVSLPERHELLCEALASVRAQTLQPNDVVVGIDPRRLGEVGNMNRLIDATEGEWLAFLHDDDLWHPDHLEVASRHMRDDVDVIVSRFNLVNRPWSTIERWHEDFNDLRWTNWIGSPSMVVARRSVFGRWADPIPQRRWVDWSNYNRLVHDGARFVDTKTVTVEYRFMGDNGSWRA